MTLPDGWEGYDPCGSNTGRPVQCGDCGWKGFEEEVEETIWQLGHHLMERIAPGEILPVGTCPETVIEDGDMTAHPAEPWCITAMSRSRFVASPASWIKSSRLWRRRKPPSGVPVL